MLEEKLNLLWAVLMAYEKEMDRLLDDPLTNDVLFYMPYKIRVFIVDTRDVIEDQYYAERRRIEKLKS